MTEHQATGHPPTDGQGTGVGEGQAPSAGNTSPAAAGNGVPSGQPTQNTAGAGGMPGQPPGGVGYGFPGQGFAPPGGQQLGQSGMPQGAMHHGVMPSGSADTGFNPGMGGAPGPGGYPGPGYYVQPPVYGNHPYHHYAPPPPMMGFASHQGGVGPHGAGVQGQGPGMAQVMEELANGGNGLSSLSKLLDFDDKEFWKGALVGAAVVLLLTNESVQETLFRTGAKAKAKVQSGVDKVREKVHQATEKKSSDDAKSGEGPDE